MFVNGGSRNPSHQTKNIAAVRPSANKVYFAPNLSVNRSLGALSFWAVWISRMIFCSVLSEGSRRTTTSTAPHRFSVPLKTGSPGGGTSSGGAAGRTKQEADATEADQEHCPDRRFRRRADHGSVCLKQIGRAEQLGVRMVARAAKPALAAAGREQFTHR